MDPSLIFLSYFSVMEPGSPFNLFKTTNNGRKSK